VNCHPTIESRWRTCYGWHGHAVDAITDPFDKERHDISPEPDPETLLRQTVDVTWSREFEGLSYRELADVTGMPMGGGLSSQTRNQARDSPGNIRRCPQIRCMCGSVCDSRSRSRDDSA